MLNVRYFIPIFIVLISLVLYANTLRNGFLYDDEQTIVKNSLIKNPNNLLKLFDKDYFIQSGEATYRPMVTLTYFLDYSIYGLKPWGYHLTNVLLHALNGLLLYIFLGLLTNSAVREQQLVEQPALACICADKPFIISLLFVTNPVLSEAVNAVSFREDLLAFLFYMTALSLYLYLRSNFSVMRHFSRSLLYSSSCLLYFLSLLSKEMAATLPLIVCSYEWIYTDKKDKGRSPFNLYVAGYVTVAFIYIWIGFYYFEKPIAAGHHDSTLVNRLLTIPWLIVNYMKITSFPVSLSVEHSAVLVKSILSPAFYIPFTVVFSILVLAFVVRDRIIAFGILFIIVSLAPVYNIIPIAHPFAERYLYLPMVGFVIVFGMIFSIISKIKKPIMAAPFLMVVIVLFSFTTAKRNSAWRDGYSLWNDAVKKMPNSSLAHSNLGLAYSKNKQYAQAMEEFNVAKGLRPDEPENYFNLSMLYQKQRQFNAAREELEIALKLKPYDPRYYTNLGIVYAELGNYSRTIEAFKDAVKLNPNDSRFYYNLGMAYEKLGQTHNALTQYQIALRINPMDIDAGLNIGFIYANQGRIDEAISQFESIMKLNPSLIDAHYNLGKAYLEKGLKDKAKAEFETALMLNPDFLPARQELQALKKSDSPRKRISP